MTIRFLFLFYQLIFCPISSKTKEIDSVNGQLSCRTQSKANC